MLRAQGSLNISAPLFLSVAILPYYPMLMPGPFDFIQYPLRTDVIPCSSAKRGVSMCESSSENVTPAQSVPRDVLDTHTH